MTPKAILLILAAIGIAPAVLWSLLSVVTAIISIAYRPISLSFRLYSSAGSTGLFRYHELPFVASLCILAGSALLIFGITSIPRAN